MQKFARSGVGSGLTCLGYSFIYLPIMELAGIEPWGVTFYGTVLLISGVVLGLSCDLVERYA